VLRPGELLRERRGRGGAQLWIRGVEVDPARDGADELVGDARRGKRVEDLAGRKGRRARAVGRGRRRLGAARGVGEWGNDEIEAARVSELRAARERMSGGGRRGGGGGAAAAAARTWSAASASAVKGTSRPA
jgi:hypothetical protein